MLVQLLTLDAIDPQRFTTRNHQENFRKTIFGGQVLAQALMAAGRTVRSRNRPVHSLHAYFLRAGRLDTPIEYWVENLRDGNSVSSRAVRAIQEGELIFTMQASFHKPENGYEHQPSIPLPQITSAEVEALRQLSTSSSLARELNDIGSPAIDFVSYEGDILDTTSSQSDRAHFWFRCNEPLPDDPLFHSCALAFASDLGLLATSMLPHPTSLFAGMVYPASMDHSIWFHRQPHFNDWHHYLTDTPWAGSGRGFCRGQVYDQEHQLVASVTQEGIVRIKK